MRNIIGFVVCILSIGTGVFGFWTISNFGPLGYLLERESWEIISLPLAFSMLIIGGFYLFLLLINTPLGETQIKTNEV